MGESITSIFKAVPGRSPCPTPACWVAEKKKPMQLMMESELLNSLLRFHSVSSPWSRKLCREGLRGIHGVE